MLVLFSTSAALGLWGYANGRQQNFDDRLYNLAISGMTGWVLAWCLIAAFISYRR